jgi:DNA-binding response OmpR family regulator
MANERSVLVIEDDRDIAELVRMRLAELLCSVKLAYDGLVGLAEAESRRYGLVILDLMLPGIDGMEVCRRLRAKSQYAPILMLTAKSSDLERVLGLEMGADDYLPKPFNALELQARVKAIFRRVDSLSAAEPSAETRIDCAELSIDPERREVRVAGRTADLTATEFDLLLHFAQNPGRVYTRAQLLDQVWGYSHSGYEHTVNSHINRLRSKIEANPNKPEYIQTVWGVGYRFRAPYAAAA